MLSTTSLKNAFYFLKPLIPRSLQILFRRIIISHKRNNFHDIWPIDESAGIQPGGWSGWPENKRFAVILQHDIETQKGQEQCGLVMDLEEELGFFHRVIRVTPRYPWRQLWD